MTASITPSSKSRPDGLAHRLAAALLFFALALFSPTAPAAEIEVKSAEIAAGEESWLLDAEFGIDLGHRLEEVVSRGVALYFVLEFDLTKARWYWMDEHVTGRSQTWLAQPSTFSAGTLNSSANGGIARPSSITWR